MGERAHEFWERVLAEIDDGGFFDPPHPYTPADTLKNEPTAARPAWCESPSGATKLSPQPARLHALYASPESWMVDVDAPETATAGLQQWQELFGPDFDRTVLLSLLPVVLALLLPVLLIPLLLMAG